MTFQYVNTAVSKSFTVRKSTAALLALSLGVSPPFSASVNKLKTYPLQHTFNFCKYKKLHWTMVKVPVLWFKFWPKTTLPSAHCELMQNESILPQIRSFWHALLIYQAIADWFSGRILLISHLLISKNTLIMALNYELLCLAFFDPGDDGVFQYIDCLLVSEPYLNVLVSSPVIVFSMNLRSSLIRSKVFREMLW